MRRYITQDPDIEASKALLDLVNDITRMDKESFNAAKALTPLLSLIQAADGIATGLLERPDSTY